MKNNDTKYISLKNKNEKEDWGMTLRRPSLGLPANSSILK
jgi:hypothetical protein